MTPCSYSATLSKSGQPYSPIIIDDYVSNPEQDWNKSVYYTPSSSDDDEDLIPNNEISGKGSLAFSPSQNGWELVGIDNDEDNEDDEDPFTPMQLEKFLSDSGLSKHALNNILNRSQSLDESEGVFYTITNGLANATWCVGQLIFSVCEELRKFVWPPKWVTEKYQCSVKNIFAKLEELQPSFKNNPESELGKLFLPVTASMQKTDFQTAHTSFLMELRNVLSSGVYRQELEKYMLGRPDYDPLILTVMELCRIRFEDGHFYNILDDLMFDIGIKGIEKLSAEDFEIIENVDPNLKISFFEVNLKKFLGHINVNFDPHLQGNIPYIFDILNMGEKKVNLMRMGTPTIEGCTGKAELIPEFRGYLQNCVASHKTHLYISLQNDKTKSLFKGDMGGDEAGRNEAIKEPQKEFPNNYFVVVLAHDSSFYKQVGMHDKVQAPEEFIDQFKTELFGDDTGFYFPQAWKEDRIFIQQVDNLLRFVLGTFFENKDELTSQEKRDFIQIFYANLALFLIDYSKADNVNITCKDAIDRAGMLNSLLLKLAMTIEGHVDTAESQRKHKVLTHSAAFWTKSQAIIKKGGVGGFNGRRERLLSADAKLNETKDNFKIKVQGNTIQEFLAAAVA